jgi:NADPH2:quinone reductase
VRAWVPDRYGPWMVRMGDVDCPTPGPDEAVVEVHAYSINRGETLLLEQPRPQWRPGKDVSGVVVEGAKNGAGPTVGTRVVAHPPSGGWAERVAVRADDLAVLPDEINHEVAAALPLAGLTALRLIRQAGPLQGRRLLITGASGGVGHYLVELAANAGAQVTALSASAGRGERLLELGAREVLPDVPAVGAPFDVVMESVGGEVFPRALRQLRAEGLLLWFGQASRDPVTLNFFEFFDGPTQASVRHFDYTRGDTGYGPDLVILADLVANRRLHPELGLVRPWTETPRSIETLRSRRVRGNAVLVINQNNGEKP